MCVGLHARVPCFVRKKKFEFAAREPDVCSGYHRPPHSRGSSAASSVLSPQGELATGEKVVLQILDPPYAQGRGAGSSP